MNHVVTAISERLRQVGIAVFLNSVSLALLCLLQAQG